MIRLIASFLLLIAVTILLANPWGQIPALGPIFHPVTGVLANADKVSAPSELTYTLDGLENEVEVWINDRGVPHVFAKMTLIYTTLKDLSPQGIVCSN
jgi:penicillin amidase